ncbi:GATOR complex protein WDR24 [Scaptodrosophila lebanonensis]|uniref:GATOR2 complex protein WDR24 n=1 Tax=Drosophila lebanonensis TaxID=7225 RepID=A0A6J2T632_DROLE|nr:GATOR complex protein WDR24 [Scaptodrosophila lebanonensis]
MPDSPEDTSDSTTSLRICLEGHANALALNNTNTQVAVAGRSLLKVFAIDSDGGFGFTEVCNMRGGKNQNLSYSSNDVAWSSLDSNILATAATNGVVSVWDLSKFGRQKQLLVFNEHERTAHTVTFHSTEPNILISGSQDGTIKCFDTRCDKSVSTYFSSESVRDVKFSPHTLNLFSAVSENGNVKMWDMRKSDKCVVQYTAHSGPIYTCDWHPTRNWLATGSRDKQIKVWNMDGRVNLEYTIHTIAVVGRVKWRPERTYHIASCALVMDYSVHVWDIRRPYIPFASFNEHTNVTTAIAWQGSNSHCLLSTSKDSTIYKHAFKDATRPALKANTQGASLGRHGDITFTKKIKEYAPKTSGVSNTKTTSFISRRKSNASGVVQFHLDHSKLYMFILKDTLMGYPVHNTTAVLRVHESFMGCAREMLLSGKKLSELCEHNAEVCKKYGKHNATTLWNFVKLFYGSNNFEPPYEHRASFSNQKNPTNSRRTTQVASDWAPQRIDMGQDVNGNSQEAPHEITHADDDDAELGGSGKQHPPTSSVILSESQIISEITFDNFELLRNGFIYVGPADLTKALAFPDTALHHDVQAARPQLDLKASDHEKSPPPHVPSVLKVSQIPPIPMWEPHQFVADALMLQNDVGDVQTALTVLIVLGDARKLLPIEDDLVEHWFQTYVDQLHRYDLWNEACLVINRSWFRSVRQLNQHSTTMHTNCGECGRPMTANGWYCEKCKSMQSAKCCVCGLIVRGLYVWCQGCSHGGHIEHLQKYFAKHAKCPKCGHLCSYS